MDGTLTLIFAISGNIRDIKKFIKRHQNTFKSHVKFQSLKDLVPKLNVPRPFIFQNQNGCHSLSFGATKKSQSLKRQEKYFSWSVLTSFCSHTNRFWFIVKNANSHFWRNSKTACLRAKTCTRHPNWNIFCSSKIDWVTAILSSKYKWAWQA